MVSARYYMVPLVVVAVLAGMASASFAAGSINVDFGPASPVYTGIGAAPDAGTNWNRVAASTASNLVDSGGAATSVGVQVDLSQHGLLIANWTAPAVAPLLMQDYLYANYPTVDRFWIKNLVPGGYYDLYLYSQNGNNVNEGTLFTVNGVDQTVKNPGPVSTFVLSLPGNNYYGNYVRYTGVEAAADGRIAVYYSDALGLGAAVNGFQLTASTVPEPSSLVMLAAGVFGLLAYGLWKRK